MKRSEMIKYLAKELRRKDKYITTNIEECKYLVEKVLKSCETKGMFPPFRVGSPIFPSRTWEEEEK